MFTAGSCLLPTLLLLDRRCLLVFHALLIIFFIYFLERLIELSEIVVVINVVECYDGSNYANTEEKEREVRL